MTDTTCLWTYERMMFKTEVYCVYHKDYYEQIGMEVEGWWMSRAALDDVMRYECLN